MKNKTHKQKRREFLSKVIAGGMVSCFSANALLAQNNDSDEAILSEFSKHKFQEDSGMSYQAVFDFTYKSWLIPFMKTFSKELGKDELITLLKKASGKRAKSIARYQVKKLGSNDFDTFKKYMHSSLDNPFMQKVGTYFVSEDSENRFEITCKECLWAKTFSEGKAPEIGYACSCHQDYVIAQTFNPKIKLENTTKSLMDGGSVCTLRYTYKG